MIKKMMFAVTLFVFLAVSVGALAAMPDELKGVWVLNAEASKDNVKTSPKWKAEDEAMLPRILERMSQVTYEFTDDTITVAMGERKQSLNVTMEKHEGKQHVFLSKIQDTEVRLTVTLDDKGNLNIKSSATDDMNYYIWMRKPKE